MATGAAWLVNSHASSLGQAAGADTKRDLAMRECPVSRELTSEPGTQRAQYYFGATSAAIFDQLEPVSPQSVTLGRRSSAAAAMCR
jgi:hypothetical protein